MSDWRINVRHSAGFPRLDNQVLWQLGRLRWLWLICIDGSKIKAKLKGSADSLQDHLA
jgi:hypothetical protein